MDDPINITKEVMPLVSVIIPTYNRLPFIMAAIDSVRQQTYKNWELIIVNDGSADGSLEAILSLTDPRIRILDLAHNGHVGWLRNSGAQLANGSLLAFLDSDDLWLPGKLEIQVKELLGSGKKWSYGKYELMDEAGKTITSKAGIYILYSGWITLQVITSEAAVSIGSLMVERNLFNEVGGFSTDKELNFREDYELALKLALKAEALALPDLLVRIREHTERSTNKLEDSHERTAAVFTKFLQMHPGAALKRAARLRRGYHIAEAAGKNISQKKYLLAVRQLAKAFIDGDDLRHIASVIRRGFRQLN